MINIKNNFLYNYSLYLYIVKNYFVSFFLNLKKFGIINNKGGGRV